MGRPSLKSPARLDRIRDLHSAGLSAHEISEDIGIHVTTLIVWLRDLGLTPNGGSGPRDTRFRPKSFDPSLVPEAVTSTALPSDRRAAVRVVGARLETVRKILDDLTDKVAREEYDPSRYGQLVKLERDLAASIAELTPPEQLDPEADPANVEGAAKIAAKFKKLIEAAERSFRCPHCKVLVCG